MFPYLAVLSPPLFPAWKSLPEGGKARTAKKILPGFNSENIDHHGGMSVKRKYFSRRQVQRGAIPALKKIPASPMSIITRVARQRRGKFPSGGVQKKALKTSGPATKGKLSFARLAVCIRKDDWPSMKGKLETWGATGKDG